MTPTWNPSTLIDLLIAARNIEMVNLDRITFDPNIMGGRACIRGMRVTAGMVVGLVAEGHTTEEILEAYPYLEEDDVRQALTYSAWSLAELE